MNLKIERKLYSIIEDLTLNGELKSFNIEGWFNGVDITINDIYNNQNYKELHSLLKDLFFENEILYQGVFYPFIEVDILKFNVIFKDEEQEELSNLWSMTDLYYSIEDIINLKLESQIEIDNLNLELQMNTNSKKGVEIDLYKLTYTMPEDDTVIDLTNDETLKECVINHFSLWQLENNFVVIDNYEEKEMDYFIEISENYLSNFIKYIHDVIVLDIID